MTEKYCIGWRSQKTVADKSKALGEHEKVVYRTWDRDEPKPGASLGDQFENLVAARINSQRGIVIHRLTNELPDRLVRRPPHDIRQPAGGHG
jgi:hypothetical protein